MKKRLLSISKAIGLAFLIAENRFFTFADREDRIILLVSFALIFGYVMHLYERRDLYKRTCEKQSERMAKSAKKALSRDTYREYMDY